MDLEIFRRKASFDVAVTLDFSDPSLAHCCRVVFRCTIIVMMKERLQKFQL